jgi:hypothetical protein
MYARDIDEIDKLDTLFALCLSPLRLIYISIIDNCIFTHTKANENAENPM